ncbi:hypothetical protein [Methylomagnum sp.]
MYLPVPLSGAHRSALESNDWMEIYLSGIEEKGIKGGPSEEEAKQHFIHRFLNSAARAQWVCADPKDKNCHIRDMIFDQLADGKLFLLDIACGNGAGTLAILSLICELRASKRIPKLPVNVFILGVDYSSAALLLYQKSLVQISPWLESSGINVTLESVPCDLKVPGDFDESLDFFFNEANKNGSNRFLCVISAITGIKKDGLEELHDSLKLAAIRLSHKGKNSSWLWIEPSINKPWLFKLINSIAFILKKIAHKFVKKGEGYNIEGDVPSIPDPVSQKFDWLDPHKSKKVLSWVMVMAFRGN